MNFLTSLLFALAFQDPSGECYVRGYIYQEIGKGYSLQRNSDDTCWVKDSLLEDKLVLFHKNRWVMIQLPPDLKGHTNFWYKWGSERAHVDNKEITIKWGYSITG